MSSHKLKRCRGTAIGAQSDPLLADHQVGRLSQSVGTTALKDPGYVVIHQNALRLQAGQQCSVVSVMLMLWLAAMQIVNVQGQTAPNVAVDIKGREKATYTISYTDGSFDRITMDLALDLTFTAHNLTLSANRYVATKADVEGKITAIVTAVQQRKDGQTTMSFTKEINYAKSANVPLRCEFSAADGSVVLLEVDISDPTRIETTDLKPYRLEYNGLRHETTVWVRLPSPFRYPSSYESYDVSLAAQVHGIAGVLTGSVLAKATRTPVAGAIIRLDDGSSVTSDAQGQFQTPEISPGSHEVWISHPRFQSKHVSTTVRPFGTTPSEFLLDAQDIVVGGSFELLTEPRPVLPGQKRVGRLTIKNMGESPLEGLVSADMVLSRTPHIQDGIKTESVPVFPIAINPGQSSTFELPVNLPPLEALGPTFAGINYMVVQIRSASASLPKIPGGQDLFASQPFWMGQVVQVLSHGFGQDMDLGPYGQVVLFPDFMGVWEKLGAKIDSALEQERHPLHGSIITQINRWNSSDGWIQAVFYKLLSIALEASEMQLAAPIADTFAKSHMQQAEAHALEAAERSLAALEATGVLASPELSQKDYQLIHLIGHSRGAAVNAHLARLLTAKGYRIEQYTALDGYSKDWPPPSDVFGDIDIVGELSDGPALTNVKRRVNYTVEDGLSRLDPVVDTIYAALEPFFRAMYVGLIHDERYDGYSARLKQAVKNRLPDWKAPDRDPPFINKRITGLGGIGEKARSNHLNVVDLYEESDTRIGDERYIFDNFVGQQLAWKSQNQHPRGHPVTLQSPTPEVPQDASLELPWKFADFRDGGFEGLAALRTRIEQAEFQKSDDSLLKLGIAMLQSSEQLLATCWNTYGDVRLMTSNHNTFIQLTNARKSRLSQFVSFPVAPLRVEFDLQVPIAEKSAWLRVTFDGHLLQEFTLTNQLPKQRYSVPLTRTPGSGELAFELGGPRSDSTLIQLDNLAIIYDQPRLIAAKVISTNRIQFGIEGMTGSRYAVETSFDLLTWREAIVLENKSGKVAFEDDTLKQKTQQYYRVRLVR